MPCYMWGQDANANPLLHAWSGSWVGVFALSLFVMFCFVLFSPVLNSHIHITWFMGTSILGWQVAQQKVLAAKPAGHCSIPRNLYSGRRESTPRSVLWPRHLHCYTNAGPSSHTYTQINELKKNKTPILITQIHQVRVGKTLVHYVGLVPNITSRKL